LTHLAKLSPAPKRDHKVSLDIFVAEASKSAVAILIHIAPEEVLARVTPGEEVILQAEGQRLLVRDEQGEYLGEVEPKYGLRLVKLIGGGNTYVAAISSLGENKVKVIIREVYQHPSQLGRPSFPRKEKEVYRSYTRDSLFRRRLEEEEPGDEGEGPADEDREGFTITDIYEFPFASEGQRELVTE
ncbi:hypothetical protein ACFLW2_04325, partial [Chloroflexota bacterium]